MITEHHPDPMDKQSYEDARRGLRVEMRDLDIKAEDGRTVWSLEKYQDQMGCSPPDCPSTVNPSLWRQATLNAIAGLFEVTPEIYQVRGYDMSNMTIIEANGGLIIIDPLISCECAEAALALYRDFVGREAKVSAIIYTHSHVDHFGGADGIIERDADVEIWAPEGFMEEATSENLLAGTAMSRRAQYMYGPYLEEGHVDVGLGKGQSTGRVSLRAPNHYVTKNGLQMVAGVEVDFQLTPGTEAPAEMNIYFPDSRAFCAAENASRTLHNIQTLRGAKVRDALAWSKYLNQALTLYGDKVEVLFGQHHWPVWGKARVADYLREQRDVYRYLHDQTLRLLNLGYTGTEIAEGFVLPSGLSQSWNIRGYYGSVSHNVKAIYDRYLGWFDGHPSTLHALPPVLSAPRYVEAMGGAVQVKLLATRAMGNGELRWAAQLLQHLVYADPKDQPAMELLAVCFLQMGHAVECGTWRNFYLMGAQELRAGGEVADHSGQESPDIVKELSVESLFDLVGARLDGPEAAAHDLTMIWQLPSVRLFVELSNGALSCVPIETGRPLWPHKAPTVRVTVSEKLLPVMLLGGSAGLEGACASGAEVSAGLDELKWLLDLMRRGDITFPIVTPRSPPIPDMTASVSPEPSSA